MVWYSGPGGLLNYMLYFGLYCCVNWPKHYRGYSPLTQGAKAAGGRHGRGRGGGRGGKRGRDHHAHIQVLVLYDHPFSYPSPRWPVPYYQSKRQRRNRRYIGTLKKKKKKSELLSTLIPL